MDLSQGKFVDDTEETILVNDKVVNGYGSDTPAVAKLRYGVSDAPSTYSRQEEKSFSFARNLLAGGATTLTSGWYGIETAGAAVPNFIGNVKMGYEYYADLLFKSDEERESPEYMTKWAERQKEEEAVEDTVKEIHKRSNDVAGKIGEALGAGEDGWGTFLGQTTGSVLTSLGVCYLTKNPTLAAITFSMPTYGNVLGTSVEKGKDLATSEGIALSSATATGILERWGFQNLIENVATKTVKGAIAKSIATEGIEELSQQVAEDVPLIFWAKDDQFVDENGKIKWMAVVKDLSAAGFGGALGGGIGGGIGASYVSHKRNKVIKGLTSNGKYTRGEAEAIVSYLESGDKGEYEDFIKNVPQIELAKKAMDSVKEDMSDPKKVSKAMTESMNDILDPANLPNESLDDFAKMVKDSKEQITEQMVKEAEVERKKYDVRDIVQEKGGADKATVEATKEAVQAFAESEAEEFGITPRDVVEGKAITLANLTDNSGLSPEEKQQILEQSGLANEDTVVAKESGVAPTQDEIDEAFALMKEEQEQEGKEPAGNVYMQEAQDVAQRMNEIDMEEQANGVPEYTAPTININGVERQTKNSDGTPIAKSEKSLRYFYNWFGDSKVVDEQGRPLVVYHGTLDLFNAFDKERIGDRWGADERGFFFIDRENLAKRYATSDFDESRKGYVMPVYISAKKPLIIDRKYALKNGLGNTVFDREDSISFWDNYQNFVLEEVDKNKNDAVIVNDGYSKMVVAFSPNQIKSVDNRGTWSGKEGNIYYQGAKKQASSKNIYNATNSKGEPVANVESFNRFIEGTHATENDDVVSETNPPKKIFRGDTRYFEEYTPQENAHEYDWGTGFYLSDDYDDVVQNYQSGGADLTNRIDREAEQYAEDNDISYDEAREQLRERYEQEDIVREFYLSMKNPVIISGDRETFFDFEESYDEETDEYGEPSGTGVELIDAIESYLYDIGADSYVYAIKGKLYEGLIDNQGLSASQMEDIVRGTEEANYLIDYNSSAGEMLSNAFRRLGFDGIIDHRAGTKFKNMNMNPDTTHYIVFDSNQAKSVDNKGEWSTSPNFYLQSEQQPRAFADITDASNILVGMLNSADISALPHEMAHVFTNLHVQNCIKYGKFNSIEAIMKYFGVTNPMELIQNRDIQERLARMSIQYVNEGEAPTAGLRRYFEMFKRFGKKLVSGWKEKGIIEEEELPDEVRKFFDSLLGKKKHGKIDYARIAEQKAEVIQAIKRIKAGEAVDVSGLPISEVRKLMKVMQTRIPRMPQNLKNALIQAGGVDINFAKNFDFVQTSGEEKNYRLFKRNGAINSEDSLISFLETNGFITKTDVEDYEDTSAQWERVENAMENMNDIYREQDMEQVLERESIEEGIQQAQEIISAVGAEDAFEVIEDIDKLKGRVVAEKEYLDSLERRVKNLDKDYKKLYDQLLKDQARDFAQDTKEQVKQAKEEIKEYRNQVVDFIKKQDLSLKDKAKLISVVKKANTKASFEKVIEEVKERAADLYRKEQVRRLSDLIQKEVSTRRPALKEQKYAYEENKLFSDLRDWNKLNKSDAGIRYQAMHSDEDFMSNLTREDEIRLLFLEYKAMGADSSPQLLNTLLNYIEIAKQVGMEARNEQEYQKAMSRDETKDEMVKQLETRKGKPTIYVKFVANLYSSLNTIFGKNIADKYELETVQNRANIRAANHIDKVVKEAMKLYNVKSKGDFLNVLAELGKKAATITTVNNNIDTPLSKVGITKELSTLEIMDIYNAIKNEKTRDDYYYWYGKDQIDALLSKLTNNEMLWADMMMASVDERYAPVNEVFVKTYYTDLPKVDNYWMATSEHKDVKTVFDVQSDFNQQSPSFLKERVKGRVLPKPMNAYSKYTKHIKGTYWVTDMAEKQVELLNLISSLRVKNAIENKLGKDTYRALKRQVEALSFGGLMEDVDYVTGVIDKAINNVVVAKISLGVPVFTGQLSSVGLYAENMGVGKWALGFAEGLAHPVQTYKFMKENIGDFLSARFGGGYDETIESVIRSSEEGKGKYSLDPKTKYNVIQALTSFVRTGDIGAIIYGGYPRLKQLLQTMPKEEAIREFEKETLRGQQSSVAASKSAFQQRKGMARVFTSFRNFQYQAVRKIVDSVYAYMNGEVNATQAGKTIGLYAIYAPIAYELFRQLGNMIFFGRDPLKDIENKLFNSVLMQELSIVPVVNDIMNYAIKKYFGQYAKSGITTVGIDDLFRSVDKLYKKKKDMYDYGEIVSPFIEMMTGVPSQRIISTTKKVIEKYK